MIFSIIALTLFMAVFITTNVLAQSAQDLALAITLHADAEAGIPEVDRNGNKWSWEQLRVLRAFAKAIYDHVRGGKPISIAVSAVAGSGKTSLLQGMTHIVAKLCPELLTAMTAFNTHIAKSSKDILIQFQSSDGLNIKVFGSSNTVNAGGHHLLSRMATGAGFSRIDYTSGGNDRYLRIARIVLAGWLGRENRIPLLEQARSNMEVKTTSHAMKDIAGTDGLLKVVSMATQEGFIPTSTIRSTDEADLPSPYVPPTPHEDDIKTLAEIVKRVGANQSWNDNPARHLGDQSVYELAVEIIAIALETCKSTVKILPFCGDGKTSMDAVVLQKEDHSKQISRWLDVKPVKGFIHSNTAPEKHRFAHNIILENAGACWPPMGKKADSGEYLNVKGSNEKALVAIADVDGHIVYSFNNGGHLEKPLVENAKGEMVAFKQGMGAIMGKNGQFTVDGENPNTWRKWNGKMQASTIPSEHLEKCIKFFISVFGESMVSLDLDLEAHDVVLSKGSSKGVLTLSMRDQIYLPHALDLTLGEHEKADCVFIDEVQDLSPLQANLVWRMTKENAHKVIVGDFRQAIYLFSGSSAQAFSENAERIGATFYPQTICWRGTEMVAASARLACQQFLDIGRGYWDMSDAPDYDSHRSPLEAGYDFWEMGAIPIQITADEVIRAYHKSMELHGEKTTFGLTCRLKKPLPFFIKAFLKAGIPVSTPATIGKNELGLVDQAFSIAKASRTKALDDSYRKVGAGARLGLGWNKHDASKVRQHSLLLRDIESMKSLALAKFSEMHKGDTAGMMNDSDFENVMGNLDLLEAFVSLHRERGSTDPVDGKNLASALKNWVNSTLFSERGNNAVHIATLHRYKGDEGDIMFLVNQFAKDESMKGFKQGFDSDGNETDETEYIECFMNQRACAASPESCINEVNMGYVAFTRAKKQNIIINHDLKGDLHWNVEQRLQGAFDRDVDLMMGRTSQKPQNTPESDSGATDEDSTDLDDRCVECSTIIVEGEEHGTCAKCGGHLCRVRTPTHSKSGKYEKHNGGQICTSSCGSYLGHISLDELFDRDFDKESRRHCSSCNPRLDDDGEYKTDGDDETDWESELEYVELETHDGKVIQMSIEDFDAWEDQNPSFEGVKEARHMSEGEVQGLFFQDTSTPCEEEPAPVLPEALPSPFVLMKRVWSKKGRGGINSGSLNHKLHIDANPDEPSGETLCGKNLPIHPTLNSTNNKSEWVCGQFGGGTRIPNAADPREHAPHEIGIGRQYTVYLGYGYSATQRTQTNILMEEEKFCANCVKKWMKKYGEGVLSPVRGFAAVQEGLIPQLPLFVEFKDVPAKEDREAFTLGYVRAKQPCIDKDDGTRYERHGIDLALFMAGEVPNGDGESYVVIQPQRRFGRVSHRIQPTWGDIDRLRATSFEFEIEVQQMVNAGRMKFTDNGSLLIPFEDELLKDVDCTDLEGEVADFVCQFLDRYMVARCFEQFSQNRIAKEHSHATVWDKMFNRLVNEKNEEKDRWDRVVDASKPHTLKEWEALPKKEDA